MRIPNQSVGMRWMSILRPERSNIVANLVMRRVISQKPNLSGGFGDFFEEDGPDCKLLCYKEHMICNVTYCSRLSADPDNEFLFDSYLCWDICDKILDNCLRDCDR